MPRIHYFTILAVIDWYFFGKSIDGRLLLCAKKFWKRWETHFEHSFSSTQFTPIFDAIEFVGMSNNVIISLTHSSTRALGSIGFEWNRAMCKTSAEGAICFCGLTASNSSIAISMINQCEHIASGDWWFEKTEMSGKAKHWLLLLLFVYVYLFVLWFLSFLLNIMYSFGPTLFIEMCHFSLICTECDVKLSILILFSQNDILLYMFWWCAIENAWKFVCFLFQSVISITINSLRILANFHLFIFFSIGITICCFNWNTKTTVCTFIVQTDFVNELYVYEWVWVCTFLHSWIRLQCTAFEVHFINSFRFNRKTIQKVQTKCKINTSFIFTITLR